MRRPGRTLPVAAAVVALAVLAVLVLRPKHDDYDVTAVFDQAYGLVQGGQVWAGGAVVGSVRDIKLGPDGMPRVRMRIDGDYRLKRTATADLRVHSNAGELNRVIVLHAGEGPDRSGGTVLTRTHTDQPVEIDDVVDTFTPAMRSDLSHVIGALNDSSRGLAGDFRAGLRTSVGGLHETAALLGAVSRDGAALQRLVREGSQVSGTFAVEHAALGTSTSQLSGLLDDVAARQTAVRQTLATAPASLRATRRALAALRGTVPTLRELTRAADPVSRQLGPTDTALLKALPQAIPALRDLAAAVKTARPGLRATGTLLRAAGSTGPVLTRLTQTALPDLDLVRSFTPEITGFLGNFAGQASTYDAVGHGIRIFSGPTNPANRAIAPDEFRSGFLAEPFARTPGSLVNQPWKDFKKRYLALEARP